MNKNHISQCCGAEIEIQGQLDDYIYYFCIKCLKRYDFFGSPSPEQPSQEDSQNQLLENFDEQIELFFDYIWSAPDLGRRESKDRVKAYLLEVLKEQDLKTRQECAEIFRKETEGVCHASCRQPLYLGYIYEKILNPNQNNKDE